LPQAVDDGAVPVLAAFPGGDWSFLWIYFSAPLLGMLAAVEICRLIKLSTVRMCAKLDHAGDRRCIHCGYVPPTDSGDLR